MSHRASTEVSFPVQIITLWSVFLLGTLFHTQLGLMPLFHGLSVAGHGEAAAPSLAAIEPVLWLMLAFFMVPLVLIVATLFFHTRPYRMLHFWTSVLFSALNLTHLVMDLFVQPIAWYQIALMVFLLLVGLIINLVAYQWTQENQPHPFRLANGSR